MRKPPNAPSLPLEVVLQSPALATAGAAALGATVCLLAAWWRGGCRDMPSSDVARQALARTGLAQWRHVKPVVERALEELLTPLVSLYADRVQIAEKRKQLASKAALAGAAKRRRDAVPGACKKLAPTPGTINPLPVRAAPYQNPRADMHALRQLASRTQADGVGLLRQRPG
jgi:hypothetical protein